MTAAVWQQILALDARCNAQRPEKGGFRTLYIRRRSQLLRENAKKNYDPNIRFEYLQVRRQLLQLKFEQNLVSEAGSEKGRSLSRISNLSGTRPYGADRASGADGSQFMRVIPTEEASASRALVGDTSIAENYAFAGVFHIFDQHKEAVRVVRFAHDEKTRLACASLDGTISICELQPEPVVSVLLKGHRRGVTCCEWSLSNDWLVSTSLDGSMILWDANNGKPLRAVQYPDGEELHTCAFSPTNNNFVIVGNNKGIVRATNVSTGIIPSQLICNLGHLVMSIVFHPNGNMFWAGDDAGGITAFSFNAGTGQLSRKKRTIVKAGFPVTGLQCRTWLSREACDPTLLVNCGCGQLFVYRVSSPEGNLMLRCSFPVAHTTSPVKSSFCPLMSFRKGVPVVTGSEDGAIYFFDLEEAGKPAFNSLIGHSSPVLDVSFNCNESFLASGDATGSVIVWTREKDSS